MFYLHVLSITNIMFSNILLFFKLVGILDALTILSSGSCWKYLAMLPMQRGQSSSVIFVLWYLFLKPTFDLSPLREYDLLCRSLEVKCLKFLKLLLEIKVKTTMNSSNIVAK